MLLQHVASIVGHCSALRRGSTASGQRTLQSVLTWRQSCTLCRWRGCAPLRLLLTRSHRAKAYLSACAWPASPCIHDIEYNGLLSSRTRFAYLRASCPRSCAFCVAAGDDALTQNICSMYKVDVTNLSECDAATNLPRGRLRLKRRRKPHRSQQIWPHIGGASGATDGKKNTTPPF